MGCNCGGGGSRQTYTVVTSDGRVHAGVSEMTAKVLVRKNGGVSTPDKRK
jgi:hypothetical protein